MTDYCILLGQVDNLDIDLSETRAVYMPPETQVANITPTTEQQKVLPDKNKYFSEVNVDAVTADIDSNITPENIKLGATILGVQGNVAPDKPDQSKTVTPSEEEQVVRADTGYELGECIVKPIPSNYEDVTAEVQEQNGIVANLQTIMQGAGDDVYYTADATATAGDIANGKTAYINGGKVTGSGKIEQEIEGVNILDFPFEPYIPLQYTGFIQNNIGDLFVYNKNSVNGLYYFNKLTKTFNTVFEQIAKNSRAITYYVFDNNDILIMTGIPIYFNANTKQITKITGLPFSNATFIDSDMVSNYNNDIYVLQRDNALYKFNKSNMVFDKIINQGLTRYSRILATPDGLFLTQMYDGSGYVKYLARVNTETNSIEQIYTGKTYNFLNCVYIENFGTLFYPNSADRTDGVRNGFFKYIGLSNTIQPISDIDCGYNGLQNYIIDKFGNLFFVGYSYYDSTNLFLMKPNSNIAIVLNADEFGTSSKYIRFLQVDNDLLIYSWTGSTNTIIKGVWKFDYEQEKFIQLTGLENSYQISHSEINGNHYFCASKSGLDVGVFNYDKTSKNLVKIINEGYASSEDGLFSYYVDGFGIFITSDYSGLGLYYKQDGTNDFIKISTDYGVTNFCKSSTEDILYIKTAYYGSIKYLSGTTYGTCETASFSIGDYAQMLDFGQYIIYCPYSLKSAAAVRTVYDKMRSDPNNITVFKKSSTLGKLTKVGQEKSVRPSSRGYLEIVENKPMLRNWDINGDYEIVIDDTDFHFKHIGWGSNKEQAIDGIVACSYNLAGTYNSTYSTVFAYAKDGLVKVTQCNAVAYYPDGSTTKTVKNEQNVHAIKSQYWLLFDVFDKNYYKFVYIE